MDKKLLLELFDNIEISEEIHRFCMEFPEYRESKQALSLWLDRLKQQLGYEQASALEEVINLHLSGEAQAYYLFGLNLRQELRAALFGGVC